MSETAAAASPAGSVDAPFPRKVWKPGGARTTILSFLFLILLPFYISLPAMLYMRVVNQLWDDAAGLVLTAVAFTIVMALILFDLMLSLRARVELGDHAVRLNLPAGRGPTPMLRYVSSEIPYAEIERVEMRREIYGNALTPVLLRGARIVTRDGQLVRLGYVPENEDDSALPYIAIAEDIAARAGQTVIDRGSVRRTVTNKMLGLVTPASANEPIDDVTIGKLNARHRHLTVVLVGWLAGLVAMGIVIDLLDQGNAWSNLAPSAQAVAEKPKPAPSKPQR